MNLGDILLPTSREEKEPTSPSSFSLSPTLPCPETPNYNCNHHYVYQQLFAELQRQASSKESQLFHTIEQLGKDNQVQRIRFNEAYDQVRRLEQKLRAAETRATTLHEQLENERLEHHATREALRIEQAEHQVTAMELPAANWDVQLSRLSDAVDNLQAQQEWFLREGMLARQIHVRSNSDVMLCVHMAESIGLLRIRLDLIRPLPRIVDEHWTRYNETWNQCLLLALGGHSEPSEMHHLWPKLTEQKVGLDSLLMGYLDAYMD